MPTSLTPSNDRLRVVVAILLAMWFQVGMLPAQLAPLPENGGSAPQNRDPAAAENPHTAAILIAAHRAALEEYTVRLTRDSDEVLAFDSRPLMVWSNPRRANGQIGHIFLWTYQRRPAAIGTVFSHPTNNGMYRRFYHELHSLSETTIAPDREREPVRWKPRGGVRWYPLQNVAAPAEQPARLQLQIRQLARRFSAHTVDRTGQRWPLRMLSRPIYRYPANRPHHLGGVLLSLLGDAGSDPELVLMIEAKLLSDGTAAWHFTPVRMTDHETFLSWDDREIWQSVRSANDTHAASADGIYQRFFDIQVPINELPGNEESNAPIEE